MKSDFLIALTQLAAERHLPRERVLEAVEAAFASAFKRDPALSGLTLSVRLNPNNGDVRLFHQRAVVEQVEDSKNEVPLEQALKEKPGTTVGDTLSTEIPMVEMSRIAAQTARQVLLQRLREEERELIFQEFAQRANEIITGTVSGMDRDTRRITVDLGRAEGILPAEEQIPTDRYKKLDRVKAFVVDVRRSPRGPEILLSRTHRNYLKRLMEIEVPEIHNGVVEVKAIMREPGSRAKVAVAARTEGVDPVGSCIGPRGVRIQNIMKEVGGERVDIIRWDKEMSKFIANALSPAEVNHVEADDEAKSAIVVVPDAQLSLAIGREGQNARLAARLTGWHLDIKGATEWEQILAERRERAAQAAMAEALAAEKVKVEAVGAEVPAVVEAAPVAPAMEPVAAEVKVQAPAAPEPVVAQAPAPAAVVPVEAKPEKAAAEEVKQPVPAAAVKAPAVKEEVKPEEETKAPEEEAEAEEEEEEEEEEQRAAQPVAIEDYFKVPVIPQMGGAIRFAEDLIEERYGRRDRVRDGKGAGGKGGRPKRGGPSGPGGGRRR